ncbi:hypothetical protein NDU88_002421 [Pleurodeles waltl]|uniref:Secreted protein n=1 Tax=Pleurodeles waltl TaxID=8319 RepID=A0AAV7REG1_PLEWA|nr:hypothetical protein NDU88_002421 [Pleurodeles waltl]
MLPFVARAALVLLSRTCVRCPRGGASARAADIYLRTARGGRSSPLAPRSSVCGLARTSVPGASETARRAVGGLVSEVWRAVSTLGIVSEAAQRGSGSPAVPGSVPALAVG